MYIQRVKQEEGSRMQREKIKCKEKEGKAGAAMPRLTLPGRFTGCKKTEKKGVSTQTEARRRQTDAGKIEREVLTHTSIQRHVKASPGREWQRDKRSCTSARVFALLLMFFTIQRLYVIMPKWYPDKAPLSPCHAENHPPEIINNLKFTSMNDPVGMVPLLT